MTLLFAFLLGLCIGSFLNVLIVRLPKEENIVLPASHCTQCGHSLRWYHNIPLLSWLVLRGRCAFCDAPISARYPVVELLGGLLFAVLALQHGLGAEWLALGALFSTLLALSVIDFDYFAVPDSLNFTALFIALALPLFGMFDALVRNEPAGNDYLRQILQNAGDGALMALLFYLLKRGVEWFLKKEALGGADIILVATMGALLGFPLVLGAIYGAALLAIVPALLAKGHKIPFVPFLALSTLICYLFAAPLTAWLEALYA